jgi:FlaA1/EpsC-like NDP-sugar epimerase
MGHVGNVLTPLRERRRVSLLGLDSIAWFGGLSLATLLRYDFEASRIRGAGLIGMICLALVAELIAGWLAGLYRGRWRLGSFEEVAALFGAVAVVTVALFVVVWAFSVHPIPLGAVVVAGIVAFLLMGAARYWMRRSVERLQRPGDLGERILVFGAGEGGAQAIDALLRSASSGQLPVALLDDDPRKRNLRIRGVPVMGDHTRIFEAARQVQAETLLIAVPSADAELIREVSSLAREAGLQLKILRPVSELLGTPVGLDDIRPLSESDLLGRRQVDLDVAAIAEYLEGKRVLVTGAGGSIGSELCRQIGPFRPAEMIMLDHDESGLHAVELSTSGRALLDTSAVVLADVRERNSILRLFEERRPEVVFHAAALKHLPLLETYPAEALKTNVWGTWHLLEAAMATGVERFVNVSTDKAADPISVLGFSKAIAARLTAHAAACTGDAYLSVRFGNVLRSSGSVLQAFDAQVAAGGPLTVTDPEVTRFFMTLEEAVQLVIQAGATGGPGEVLVLDMGEPVRITDVARRFVEASGRPLEIVHTGLRPGEKLHEVILGESEVVVHRSHPLISHVPIAPLDPTEIVILDSRADPQCLREKLRALCVDEQQPDSRAVPLAPPEQPSPTVP